MSNFAKKVLYNHSEEITPPVGLLDIEETIKWVLSHLFAWDYLNEDWKQAICDSDGRLLVSTSKTKSDEGNNSAVSIDTGGDTILSANGDRKEFIIQNEGSVDCYIVFGDTPLVASGMILAPNVSFSDEIYTGQVTGITETGSTTLRVVEFT